VTRTNNDQQNNTQTTIEQHKVGGVPEWLINYMSFAGDFPG